MAKKKKDITKKSTELEERRRARVEIVMNPAAGNAAVIKAYRPGIDDVNVAALNDELARQSERIKNGDVGRMEEILICHAHALDAIFQSMMVKSAEAKSLKAMKIYGDMGLKAQRQTRAVLSVLTNLKKPRVYVKNLISNQEFHKTTNTMNKITASHGMEGPYCPDEKDITPQITDGSNNEMGYTVPAGNVRYGEDLATVGAYSTS